MNWRIYRLPGSREIWHIDSGAGSQIFNVRGYRCTADSESIDIGGDNSPRAWIQVSGDLHIVNGVAHFRHPLAVEKFEEPAKCAAALE